MHNIRSGASATAFALLIMACGSTETTSTAPDPAVTVEIKGAASRMLLTGDTTRLVAVPYDPTRGFIGDAAVTWSSSDSTVAAVNSTGLVTARRAGLASVIARAGAASASTPVAFEVANWRVEPIPASLATPAPGALWEIPVVIIRYVPTLDGVSVDKSETIIGGTIDNVVRRIEALEPRIKFMLEEGSRFHGYRDAQAPYSLGYRVVHIVTVFAHFSRGKEVPWNAGHYFPDYHQIFAQVNAQSWVNDSGVKEFWVWGYHSAHFEQPESNMSSPFTGNISNSSRFTDDLPLYRHTYTVYGYNYARTQAEAVHDHGHQLEALLGHIDHGLFWRDFVGRDSMDTRFVTGRAGWTHMPPNTTNDYDYLNSTIVQSDIASWVPSGGARAPVSMSTWGDIPYAWPSTRMPGEVGIEQRVESQWYMYWMQNMPGRGNSIPHGGGTMTNWWRFTGDWDGAIAAGDRLSTATSAPYQGAQ